MWYELLLLVVASGMGCDRDLVVGVQSLGGALAVPLSGVPPLWLIRCCGARFFGAFVAARVVGFVRPIRGSVCLQRFGVSPS